MKLKKLGKPKIDLETHLWEIPGLKAHYFRNNPRLVEGRTDYKQLKAAYAKVIQMDTPSSRKVMTRETYFQAREVYRQEMKDLLTQIYNEILQESFSYPIPLQKDKDHNFPRQWRHTLYRGFVYDLGEHGCSDEAIIEAVEKLEPKVEPANPEAQQPSEE